MRSRFVLSLVAAAAGLAGCVTPGTGFSCPAAGGPAWHVASSRGFEIWTDAGAEVAGTLAADLERLQATLAADLERMQAARAGEEERRQLVWSADLQRPPAALPARRGGSLGRVRVVLLSDRAQLADLTGPGVSGFITTRTDPPTIVVDAGRALANHSVLAHELAHHLVERWLVRPPRWLDEGLAEHLETAGAPGTLPGTVGSTPTWSRGGWRPEPGFVRRVLAWDGRLDPAEPRRHSSESWALVHFLVNEEPARLAAFLSALEAGRPAAAAFDSVFPEWSPGRLLGAYQLEARVVAFLEAGRHRTAAYPDLAHARADVSVRLAPSADLHLLRLELPRRERRPVEAVRAEVEAALREDPGHPEALRWRAQLDNLAPLPLALAAVEAHPRDWRAWRFLAGALPPEGEEVDREEALRRALELAPDRPELLRSLAQHLAGRGRHAEAAPLARLAAELAPWDPAVVAVYASVALELRACPVDRVAASRAAALGVEPALDPERRGLARALDALEQRCELARFADSVFAPDWAIAGSP